MAANSIGEELRRERLRQGLTLDDIVKSTRISPRFLEAIESDEFDRLPGTVFARNFVRLYATELKLDPEVLTSRLPKVDIESAPLPNPPIRSRRSSWNPRLTAALASVLWLVTAMGAGTGAWYYFSHYGQHSAATVAVAPAPARQSVAPVQMQTQQAISPSPSVPETAPSDMNSAPAASSEPRTAAPAFDGSRPVQVVLTAREAAWVQVSADGHTAFVGILHPNDKRAIAADAQVKILTGNAGGLDISLNGKPLDPIGPSGQVRTVRLTAEGPQLVPRTPPASSPL